MNTQHPFSACTSDERGLLWGKHHLWHTGWVSQRRGRGRVHTGLVSLYLENKERVKISMAGKNRLVPTQNAGQKFKCGSMRSTLWQSLLFLLGLIGTSTVSTKPNESWAYRGSGQPCFDPYEWAPFSSSVHHSLPVARLRQAWRQKAQSLARSPNFAHVC